MQHWHVVVAVAAVAAGKQVSAVCRMSVRIPGPCQQPYCTAGIAAAAAVVVVVRSSSARSCSDCQPTSIRIHRLS